MTELFSEDITKAVEALLFVAGEPLTVKDLADYTGSDESNGHSGEHRQGGSPVPGSHRPGRRLLLRAAQAWAGAEGRMDRSL